MVFDGEELLEFAASAIRKEIDYISATYQKTSYFGNPCGPDLIPTLKRLESNKLIDELIFYEPNLRLPPKENEVRLRNLGLEHSRKAGCSHHISSDVDEFYQAEQLKYAKQVMDADDYDFSIATSINYYKDPTFLVYPDQGIQMSLIHPVDNRYDREIPYPAFPFPIEITRRLARCKKYKVFSKDEITIHHMSYVRKDIRRKFQNSDNARCYQLENFYKTFDNYKLGNRVCLLPDYLNRTTIKVENQFNIHF